MAHCRGVRGLAKVPTVGGSVTGRPWDWRGMVDAEENNESTYLKASPFSVFSNEKSHEHKMSSRGACIYRTTNSRNTTFSITRQTLG